MTTNPTEKDKNVFKKDPAPFLVEGPVVGEESRRNNQVVEYEKGDESPIQRWSPVLTKIRSRRRSHYCRMWTRIVPESQENR